MKYNAKDFTLPIKTVLEKCTDMRKWVDEKNKFDLGNPQALYTYNKCIFKILEDITLFLDVSKDNPNNLIPTAGLRRCITAIILEHTKAKKVIEIGTGASAIMALLFARNNVEVIATEINESSFLQAQKHIEINKVEAQVTLVKSEGGILNYLEEDYFPADCVLSLPPYYGEKTKIPPKKKGFQGIESELYSFGEETDFSLRLFDEWYDTGSIAYLCILWKNIEAMQKALLTKKNFQVQTQQFEIKAGTRTRILTIMKHNNF